MEESVTNPSPDEKSKIEDSLDAMQKFSASLGPNDIYSQILIEELFKVLCKK